jgi:hypothetical protein
LRTEARGLDFIAADFERGLGRFELEVARPLFALDILAFARGLVLDLLEGIVGL